MNEDALDGKGVIAERLDRLFASVQPLDRPYTLREATESINAQAGETLLSIQYLSQLRNGDRRKPSYDVLQALARFFGVPVTYFSDSEVFERTEEELRVLNLMKDSGIRSLAFRANGISQESLALLSDLLDKLRLAEGMANDPSFGQGNGADR
ncbi:MAG: helix-turn-helix domain-containing protein [Trebonia sp.]